MRKQRLPAHVGARQGFVRVADGRNVVCTSCLRTTTTSLTRLSSSAAFFHYGCKSNSSPFPSSYGLILVYPAFVPLQPTYTSPCSRSRAPADPPCTHSGGTPPRNRPPPVAGTTSPAPGASGDAVQRPRDARADGGHRRLGRCRLNDRPWSLEHALWGLVIPACRSRGPGCARAAAAAVPGRDQLRFPGQG